MIHNTYRRPVASGAPRLQRFTALWALALLIVASPVAATTSEELLERAIYAEETVGDLDQAIALYEQVAEQADANLPHVALAHYRLAHCHLRQGRDDDARAALEALVRDFPGQKDLVAQARHQLATLESSIDWRPAPWVDGEQLHYRIRLVGGQQLGLMRMNTRSEVVDGTPAWRFETRRFIFAGSNSYGVSRVSVDRETQRPLVSHFSHGSLGRHAATYARDGIEIKNREGTVRLDSAGVFDNEQAMALMRLLPLEPDYKTELRLLPIWTGIAVDVDLEVTGRETVEVPAGTFDCDVVELSVDNQTFWISTGPERYLVKVKASGAVIELAGVDRVTEDAPLPFAIDDEFFTFAGTLPAGWLAHPFRQRETKGVVRLLDTDALTISSLEFDQCPKEGCPGVEETAERELKGAQKRFKDWTLRQDSWRSFEIDGHSAIAFAGDFDNDGQPWVQYRIYTLSEDTRFEFIFRVPADQFETLRPEFDAILASLRTR